MYVIRAQTGEETEVCKILREKHLYPILPSKIMYIRRFGKWRKEEQILMPGYIFLKKNEWFWLAVSEMYRKDSLMIFGYPMSIRILEKKCMNLIFPIVHCVTVVMIG